MPSANRPPSFITKQVCAPKAEIRDQRSDVSAHTDLRPLTPDLCSESGRARLASLLALCTLLLALCSLPLALRSARAAGVSEPRAIATGSGVKVSGRSTSLPLGVLTRDSSQLTAHSLSWLSDSSFIFHPSSLNGPDLISRFFATRNARTVALPQPGAESLGLSARASIVEAQPQEMWRRSLWLLNEQGAGKPKAFRTVLRQSRHCSLFTAHCSLVSA